MKLNEVLRTDEENNSGLLTDIDEIKVWLKNYADTHKQPYFFLTPVFRNDGSLDYIGEFTLTKEKTVNGHFPFQLNKCNSITVEKGAISSFLGFPRFITRFNPVSINLSKGVNVSSWEGITPRIPSVANLSGVLDLSGRPLSFHNISSYIKSCDLHIIIHEEYVGPILDFLNIENLNWVDAKHNDVNRRALEILNRHLENGRDTVACRNELIKANLKEFV